MELIELIGAAAGLAIGLLVMKLNPRSPRKW